MPAAAQRLQQWGGRRLADDERVGGAGLRDGDLLQLTGCLRGGAPVQASAHSSASLPATSASACTSARTGCITSTASTPRMQVQVLPQGLACGQQVTVDIDEDTPLLEVKRQLALATGVPVQAQHLMLSAINRLVMGDKRVQKFSHVGTASSLHFVLVGAAAACWWWRRRRQVRRGCEGAGNRCTLVASGNCTLHAEVLAFAWPPRVAAAVGRCRLLQSLSRSCHANGGTHSTPATPSAAQIEVHPVQKRLMSGSLLVTPAAATQPAALAR